MINRLMRKFHTPLLMTAAGFVLIAIALYLTTGATVTSAQENPLHPTFALLDTDGNSVIETGNAVSTMQTCGSCHDTEFIASHSVHADVGLSLVGRETYRDWQVSNGLYGGWDPIHYGYLSERDLDLDGWIQTYGLRHAGGGPVAELGVEMNCFLCHLEQPSNEARINELVAGNYTWASTATLANTSIVTASDAGWQWNTEAFDNDGQLLEEFITVGSPSNANCGQCHGVVHDNAQEPLVFESVDTSQWHTLVTGQLYSPQRISNSGMNIANKDELTRTWDVHAERVVNCIDCHYSLNNPVFFVESDASRPEHLIFDPRRMEINEFLTQPLHQFANGGSEYDEVFPAFTRSSRTCTSCHEVGSTHDWLPYADRHTEALACETCHIPQLTAPALESVDWTVLNADGGAVMSYRGMEGDGTSALLTGYQPVILPQEQGDNVVLAPYNLVTSWYWVYGDPAQPVPLEALQNAWLDDGEYAADIVARFDANADGVIDADELVIDSEEKTNLIADRLAEQGIENAHIAGDVEAYGIHHNVTHGEWAISNCETCHSENSLLAAPMVISDHTPGGAEPTFINSDNAELNGALSVDDNGTLMYDPAFDVEPVNFYIMGKSNVSIIDWIGVLLFLGSLAGVTLHGGLRYLAARRAPAPSEPELREVYMYTIYERQWHWLQTVDIFGLIFTGLVIHKPDMFGMFSFRYIVLVHNALAIILVINAALAAFYHLVSGEIQQFLPKPYGFFNKMFAQARYYLWGIFHNEPHPFDKTPDAKMNPIQQLTYFGLLNVLLPLQVLTGIAMWGAQQWPDVTASLGGLPFLAPFHSLIAWLLATFIVVHVYMTTTGHTPLANIRAMIFGWDEVETHGTESHGTESTGATS
ncbi:MAG: cytochrome b/b6 domain-containing protein [Anaerolineae bacterium]|nr:cytochrome b/b6 domain-containing protein [Anaerolineae bacterium]